MRVFRQRYKGRDGETKLSAKWYVEIKDHNDKQQRIAAFTDKGQSGELGRRLEKLVAIRVMRDTPDPELSAWLETLPGDLRERLLEFGLLDKRSAANAGPLMCPLCHSTGTRLDNEQPCECDGAHLGAFRRALVNKGNTEAHADTVTARVRNSLKACEFLFYGDISASRVQEYLAEERSGEAKMSFQTSNFYLAALKQFCKWMVKDRRARENPVAHLDGLNVKLDRRHDRRNLTAAELSKLLVVTAKADRHHKLNGKARAMLYRVAMETGLRRKELRALTPSSFDFEGDAPTVAVVAGESKNRKATLLPIRPELAAELRQWFQTAGIGPTDALWPKLTAETAKMLKADLEAAGFAYVDDAGLFADFHSLRHSFISMLAAGNVHPKLAQRLARHSDINLTMSRYSHTLLADEAQALDALPQFPSAFSGDAPEQQSLRATGTDGAAEGAENVLPSCLPARAAKQHNSVHRGASTTSAESERREPAGSIKNAAKCEDSAASSAERGGLVLPGFRNFSAGFVF